MYLSSQCHEAFDWGALALLPLGLRPSPYNKLLTFSTIKILGSEGDIAGRIFDPRVDWNRQQNDYPDRAMLLNHFAQCVMESFGYEPHHNRYDCPYLTWLWEQAHVEPTQW